MYTTSQVWRWAYTQEIITIINLINIPITSKVSSHSIYLFNICSFRKDWCWNWNSNTLDISCKELTHWKRPWCWEGLGAGGEGDNRGWNGWMASPTWWTWVWVNSGSWWWTGRPGVLRFTGSQRVGHDWATELNWTELNWYVCVCGKEDNIREMNIKTRMSYHLKPIKMAIIEIKR